MQGRGQARGFTLLELLVATTLFALVSLTVLIGMRVGFGAWERGQRRLEMGAQEEAVQEYLSHSLASAVAYVAAPADPSTELRVAPKGDEKLPRQFLPFQGNRQGLRWLTTYTAAWRERSGLALVECFLAEDGAERQLVVQEFPVRGDAILTRQMLAGVQLDPETNLPKLVYRPFVATDGARRLVSGARDVRFEFLKVTPQAVAWQPTWDPAQEKRLPAAVRIFVETASGERSWTIPIHSQVQEGLP